MPSEITRRVIKHRAARGIVRVEVEVPTAEDAAAVRRFARERRSAHQVAIVQAVQAEPNTEAEPLTQIIGRLDSRRHALLRLFAAGLAAADTPALIARAERIARNYVDVATAQQRTGGPRQEGRGV